MTATQVLTGVPTQKLRAGDIVLSHGMRVRLDTLRTHHGGHYFSPDGKTEGTCHQGYGPAGTESCCVIYAWSGTVTNLEEVREARIVPVGWLRTDDGRTDQWTVQGNYLATWRVERTGN